MASTYESVTIRASMLDIGEKLAEEANKKHEEGWALVDFNTHFLTPTSASWEAICVAVFKWRLS